MVYDGKHYDFPRNEIQWKLDKGLINKICKQQAEYFESEPDPDGMFLLRIGSKLDNSEEEKNESNDETGIKIQIQTLNFPQNVYQMYAEIKLKCYELGLCLSYNWTYEMRKSTFDPESCQMMIKDVYKLDSMTLIANVDIYEVRGQDSRRFEFDTKWTIKWRRYLRLENLATENGDSDQRRRLYLWLRDTVGHGEYYEEFLKQGFDDLSCLVYLDMEGLEKIGVTRLAHRYKILHAIKKLEQVLEVESDSNHIDASKVTGSQIDSILDEIHD